MLSKGGYVDRRPGVVRSLSNTWKAAMIRDFR